jgi:predicted MFS family arabinose efflux permease
MLWGNVAQAVAATVLVAGGADLGIGIAMAVLLVNASLAALLLPAENALLPALVAEDDLGPANVLNAMNDNLGRIAGPMVGAVAYAQIGIQGVATINAVSFLAAALLVRAVTVDGGHRRARSEAPVSGDCREPVWRSLRAGVGIVRADRLLGILVLILGMVAFADGPLAAMIPPFVDVTLGEGVEGVGTFSVFRGVAGILGGIVIGLIGGRVREDRLLVAGAALNGIGFAAMAVVRDFGVACVILLVVIGPAHIALHTTLRTLLQRGSEDAYRGRVFALVGAVTGALFLVGTVGGSAAGAMLSPAVVVVVSGLLFVVVALAALLAIGATAYSSPRSGDAPRVRYR